MKKIIEKIKKIKISRINEEDRYLLNFLNNLTEEWNGYIITYRQKNTIIFEYDINTYSMYFNFEICEIYYKIFYDRIKCDDIDLDITKKMLEFIKENLNIKSVKKRLEKEIEDILFEEGKITYNPLFNSITGKCSNIRNFYPILIDIMFVQKY